MDRGDAGGVLELGVGGIELAKSGDLLTLPAEDSR